MPADGFAFAVGVGCEDQGIVVFQRVGDGLDMLAAVISDLPFHLEIMFGIDRAILGRQVADMAVGCQNRVAGPQIFVYCLGFSWGLDNDYGHENS